MGLNSRQGGGGDLPSLDFAFALDKTLTARKGPTPAFTRSSTATFVGSNGLIQSAIIDAPRFDHDPVTGLCKGLLIEETRTNLVFPSETLTTQTRAVTAVAHTLSFYGAGTVVLSGVHSATVVGTGVFPARTTLTFTPTAGSLTLTVTGTVQFAQLEAGAFPLSYIPTTSGTAARSADVCSIVGDAFSSFYNQSEGTLAIEVYSTTSSSASGAPTFLALSDGTINNAIAINRPTGTTSASAPVSVSNSPQFESSTISSVFASSGLKKLASAYKTNDLAFSAIGGSPILDTSASLPTTLNAASIGTWPTSSRHINGHIARIQYFRKRLSNAKLQTLTAP